MGSFASLAFGALSNKSSSFWSVLGTPKMRRGKSMDVINKDNTTDVMTQNSKQNTKKRLFGFLGTSADYIRGKIRDDHHLSIDSDPGMSNNYVRNHCNGPKRLTRGETIDTMSLDSIDDNHDILGVVDEYSKQDTIDSSVYEDSGSGTPVELVTMHRAHSDCLTSQHPSRDSQDRMTSSVGAMNTLTVDYAPNDRTFNVDINKANNHSKDKH